MKRLLALLLCFICVITIPAHAAETITTQITGSENGLRVVDQITVEQPNTRSYDRTATRTRSFYDGDTLIAEISFKATFRYDGTNVMVIYRNVTQTDTYNGWSYTQESFTDSGGTVTLVGKLKYLLILNSSTFTMSMTCDANGNISY